jgi:hypothetical protein
MPYNPGGQTGPPGPPGPTAVIQDEGVPLAGAPHTTLNFVGAGVTATDAGFGVALITIPGGGGAIAFPLNEIVFGTGASVTSDPDFTYNIATGAFFVNTTDGLVGSVAVANPDVVGIFGADATAGSGGGIAITSGSPQVAGNDSGTIRIQTGTNTVSGNSGDFEIKTGDVATGNSGGILLNTGSVSGVGNGGDINIQAGTGGVTSGDGGNLLLQSGAPSSDGAGGDITITAADSQVGNFEGGDINITGGKGSGTETGGDVIISAGGATGTGDGGAARLRGGPGGTTSGTGGIISIISGLPIEGDGGQVTIQATSGVGTNRSGGTILIRPGDKTGTGIAGPILLDFPTTSELQLNTDPGAAGEVITSQGPNLPPVWGASSAPSVFTSTDQTITSAGALTIAHGLGAVPDLVQTFLVNQTAQHGYAVGDIVVVGEYIGSAERGTSLVVDATNLEIRYSSSAAVFNVLNKTTGTSAAITPANWLARFRAVKF